MHHLEDKDRPSRGQSTSPTATSRPIPPERLKGAIDLWWVGMEAESGCAAETEAGNAAALEAARIGLQVLIEAEPEFAPAIVEDLATRIARALGVDVQSMRRAFLNDCWRVYPNIDWVGLRDADVAGKA